MTADALGALSDLPRLHGFLSVLCGIIVCVCDGPANEGWFEGLTMEGVIGISIDKEMGILFFTVILFFARVRLVFVSLVWRGVSLIDLAFSFRFPENRVRDRQAQQREREERRKQVLVDVIHPLCLMCC